MICPLPRDHQKATKNTVAVRIRPENFGPSSIHYINSTIARKSSATGRNNRQSGQEQLTLRAPSPRRSPSRSAKVARRPNQEHSFSYPPPTIYDPSRIVPIKNAIALLTLAV